MLYRPRPPLQRHSCQYTSATLKKENLLRWQNKIFLRTTLSRVFLHPFTYLSALSFFPHVRALPAIAPDGRIPPPPHLSISSSPAPMPHAVIIFYHKDVPPHGPHDPTLPYILMNPHIWTPNLENGVSEHFTLLPCKCLRF